ncbi:MAG: hypothetical protein AAF430_25980 [Myxococcota bacterium]
MRSSARFAVITAAILSLALPAMATVNHGDFAGTDVTFRDVSETTTSAGDAEPLWEAPSLGVSGDQLLFFPTSFLAQCAAGTSDVTSSTLTTTLDTTGTPGATIDTVQFAEAGDGNLTQFPPFGDPSTNVSVTLTGTVTVTETLSGPIAPVVIPVSGTFAPSGSFALPTDFGAISWNGGIGILDVAAVVPNATKVDVSLDNTLTANCAATASALIQKKAVTGPTVAISVNPIECDIDVDKTCCVLEPVNPDLDVCEGDVVRLVMKYTGKSCRASNNDQGRAFRCYGRRKVGQPANISIIYGSGNTYATPNSNVMKGDLVTFQSTSGTLDEWTKIKVTGPWWRRQILKIDTSCNRTIACGDRFGAFEVVEVESTIGGVNDCTAPPPPPVCAGSQTDPVGTVCDARVVDMVLEYTGQDCQDPLGNPQSGFAACDGDATGASNVGVIYTGDYGWSQIVSPASGINDGDRIRVSATWFGGLQALQSFKIVDASGVRQTVDFKVWCSQDKPLSLGDEFGSLKVVGFTTQSGQHAYLGDGTNGQLDACEVPLAPPAPHCTSDLQSLTLVYIGDFLGEGCTVSNDQFGNATCTGVADPGDPVLVAAGAGLTADPIDMIEFGDLVTLEATAGGDLPTWTTLDTTGAGGTQTISLKTSCHKPLSLGDRFGSWVVFGMDRQEEGPITLGGNVEYQYKVTNPNASQLDNITIDDDQLGVIASGLSLAPGEMTTVKAGATLFGTTTNVVTVTGDVGGDVCAPATDQVTIGVTAPPPGTFYCSEPISELTLIWNGVQNIDVTAWEGGVGTSLIAAAHEDVAPGEAITVSGLGADYPVFEIFEAGTTNKLGESSFDLWCNDYAMNGVEDCGKAVGNLKWDDPTLINTWGLEGMVDTDETLSCTPTLVPNPPVCGFGPELALLLPGLLWWQRRRLQSKA